MQVQDAAQRFFMTELSTTHLSLPDLEMMWLESKGYTNGTIDERWRAYAEDNAIPSPEKYNSFLIRDYVVANPPETEPEEQFGQQDRYI